jgi:glycosyltransferase involved in cell wall biosynthesis
VTIERDSAQADVLVVAPLSETTDHPHGGIFTRREIDAVRGLGIRSDLMAIANHASSLGYVVAAARLAGLGLRGHHRYSLVHAYGGETALAASAYRAAPLLVSYLGSDLLGHPAGDGHVPAGRRLRSTIIRQHSRLTAATITMSQPMAAALPAAVRRRNHVIPHGVDLELFRPRARDSARAELGWDPDERVILYASNPNDGCKRFPLASAVAERVAARLGRVRMHVAHGLRPEVMPNLMNASDCLLHPSASEGSPNVIKEALACNLPIVATPVGDIPERLDGLRDCFICPARVDQLAAAVLHCLDPPRRTNGRQGAAALDHRRVAQEIAAVYGEMIGERTRRD